jgi:replicative DNA helicase
MDSNNFSFIESALVLSLCDPVNYKRFRFPIKNFAVHGEAVQFINSYHDQYKEFPEHSVLIEKFPKLRKDALTVSFDYAQDEFKKQIMFREVVQTFASNKELLTENPKTALGRITNQLQDIEVVYDDDVFHYDSGALSRYEEWQARSKKRKMGDGLIGIKTPFKAINSTGMGWQPGDLISAFARPTVGKTWLCIKTAATAIMEGHRTLLISTEMSKRSIEMRLDVVLANMMGYSLSHRAIRTGQPIDEDHYKEFLESSNSKRLLICDHINGEDSISLSSIANLIRKYSPDITVIDGVYLISTADSRKAAWEQSHSLFYGLKNFALAQNTAIMVSTQATRDAGANMFSPPRADQVAFGDALIRASDVALSMCMVEDFDDRREVQFQKYRDGDLPVDNCTFTWKVDSGLIEEFDLGI